jgi:hypothetical protein
MTNLRGKEKPELQTLVVQAFSFQEAESDSTTSRKLPFIALPILQFILENSFFAKNRISFYDEK